MEETMNIHPLHDYVAIQPNKEAHVSPGGIVIPESSVSKPTRGKVLATGPGKQITKGECLDIAVKVGDYVLFDKTNAHAFTINNQEILMLQDQDIICILEE